MGVGVMLIKTQKDRKNYVLGFVGVIFVFNLSHFKKDEYYWNQVNLIIINKITHKSYSSQNRVIAGSNDEIFSRCVKIIVYTRSGNFINQNMIHIKFCDALNIPIKTLTTDDRWTHRWHTFDIVYLFNIKRTNDENYVTCFMEMDRGFCPSPVV